MSMQKIVLGMQRSREGLLVRVQAAPEVEEFFAVNGSPVPIDMYVGRLWTAPKDRDKLMVHPIPLALKGTIYGSRLAYRLDSPNSTLEMENGDVNLSMLRLRGISDPEGVVVLYRNVMSTAGIAHWLANAKIAVSNFYLDYLKPVNMTLVVSTKEQ